MNVVVLFHHLPRTCAEVSPVCAAPHSSPPKLHWRAASGRAATFTACCSCCWLQVCWHVGRATSQNLGTVSSESHLSGLPKANRKAFLLLVLQSQELCSRVSPTPLSCRVRPVPGSSASQEWGWCVPGKWRMLARKKLDVSNSVLPSDNFYVGKP